MKLASWREVSEELENGIRILVGQVVLELLITKVFCMLINNSGWAPQISPLMPPPPNAGTANDGQTLLSRNEYNYHWYFSKKIMCTLI